MRDDELQVLGESNKLKRHNRWKIAIVFMAIAVALGLAFHWVLSLKQPEKIKTGKTMGESTIVLELQAAADSLLNDKLTEINGLQGQVIVMEVQTGEILAIVGLERNFEGKFQPCNNFAYQQDLGSFTMTVSLLAALETGKVKLSQEVDVEEGVYQIEDNIFMRDLNWKRGGYGKITYEEALKYYSNIGIGKAVNKAFGKNQQLFFDSLERMSFGQPDSIDGIEGLKAISYRSPKDSDWLSSEIWWNAIGYGCKIAPIQMLTFYNAIANDGRMVKPTLKTGEIEIINPQIASKAGIDSMQVALENVVIEGFGKRAATPYTRVVGKPADSQVDWFEDGDNTISEYQVGFCGYFPADNPKYSMIVSMNKLGQPASGGGMAGQLFHDIVEWMITHDMSSIP